MIRTIIIITIIITITIVVVIIFNIIIIDSIIIITIITSINITITIPMFIMIILTIIIVTILIIYHHYYNKLSYIIQKVQNFEAIVIFYWWHGQCSSFRTALTAVIQVRALAQAWMS